MNQPDLRREAIEFFDRFVAAFREFDGERIAQRYVAPYQAMHTDGSIRSFAEQREIGAYFQRVVDEYHAQGCRSCRYLDLELLPLGSRGALATVTWQLLDGQGGVLRSWRESYGLSRAEVGLRIFVSVDHAD